MHGHQRSGVLGLLQSVRDDKGDVLPAVMNDLVLQGEMTLARRPLLAVVAERDG